MLRLRLAAVALLLLSGNARADLRAFDVDPVYRQEVFSALRSILTPDQGLIMEANGRVELLPSGQLLVNAPPETLTQVEAVIAAIRQRQAEPTPRAMLRYWAVLGNRTNVPELPGTAPPPVLRDVLAEMERLHGDLTFSVIGTAAVASNSGQAGNVSGMAMEVSQTAHVQGDVLNARIAVNLIGNSPARFDIGQIIVNTTLRRGEFVVLGESELKGGDLDGPVFFIVHWAEE